MGGRALGCLSCGTLPVVGARGHPCPVVLASLSPCRSPLRALRPDHGDGGCWEQGPGHRRYPRQRGLCAAPAPHRAPWGQRGLQP